MEYSLLGGGKRLRPVLVLMGAEVCGGSVDNGLAAACAIEMVHTYSLIHDDLPCMDDDDLRRGRPTSHIVFGEALAVLAGDALLTLSFETLATASVSAGITADCLRVLATAAGGGGMVGGQILDLEAERGAFEGASESATALRSTAGKSPGDPDETSGENPGHGSFSFRKPVPGSRFARNLRSTSGKSAVSRETLAAESSIAASRTDCIHVDQLVRIHRMKTGALITAALELGAAVAEADRGSRNRLRQFGDCIGLAFQIADDLLDVTGSNERLGKETGRDHELGKLTYPSLIGVEESRSRAQALVEEACVALDTFDEKADSLRQLARFIVERDH